MNKNPLFILGNRRSGTSLFRIILSNHPEVCVPPECGFIQWWYHKYFMWNIDDTRSLQKVETFINDLENSKKIETWNLNFKGLKKRILNSSAKNYSELCMEVIEQFAIQNGKSPQYLGDKNNYYVAHTNLLELLFPQAFFIHIVRDGRDVACSYLDVHNLKTSSKYKPVFTTSISDIAHQWVNNNKSIASLKSSNYFLMKYEDLIIDPKETLSAVCKFLKIPFSSKMMDYYKNDPEGLEPKETLDWKKKITQKPDKSRINRFEDELTSSEKELFLKVGGSTLKKYGYE